MPNNDNQDISIKITQSLIHAHKKLIESPDYRKKLCEYCNENNNIKYNEIKNRMDLMDRKIDLANNKYSEIIKIMYELNEQQRKDNKEDLKEIINPLRKDIDTNDSRSKEALKIANAKDYKVAKLLAYCSIAAAAMGSVATLLISTLLK